MTDVPVSMPSGATPLQRASPAGRRGRLRLSWKVGAAGNHVSVEQSDSIAIAVPP